jgi:hypothetical protein
MIFRITPAPEYIKDASNQNKLIGISNHDSKNVLKNMVRT